MQFVIENAADDPLRHPPLTFRIYKTLSHMHFSPGRTYGFDNLFFCVTPLAGRAESHLFGEHSIMCFLAGSVRKSLVLAI